MGRAIYTGGIASHRGSPPPRAPWAPLVLRVGGGGDGSSLPPAVVLTGVGGAIALVLGGGAD